MPSTVAEHLMPAEKKNVPFQVRCAQSWLDRVSVAAEQKDIPIAAYIRMVVTERMDADGIPRPDPKKKRRE